MASPVVQLDSLSEAGLSPHSELSGDAHRVIGDFSRSAGGDVRESIYIVSAHATRPSDCWRMKVDRSGWTQYYKIFNTDYVFLKCNIVIQKSFSVR